MTPGFNKHNRNLSAITLVLVAVLLFIRINPIYYAAQFIPVRNADAHSVPAVNRADNNHIVLRCQRGISEQIKNVAIPQIRFTGIPFTAFFGTSLKESASSGIVNFFSGVTLSNARRVAALRNLRL